MKGRSIKLLTVLWTLSVLVSPHAAPTYEEMDRDTAVPPVTVTRLDQGERLRVVATTNIIGDVVSRVGGDEILLTVLMEPGQDPHSYEPTPRALVAVEDAHVVWVNGGGLEEALLTVVDATARGLVVAWSADLGDRVDPHYWTDPNNVMVCVRTIAEVLGAADPTHKQSYDRNADRYLADLKALDSAIREQIARVPENRRHFITDHDIFGYYAHAYDLQVVATVLPGSTTTSSASARRIAELVRTLRDEQVGAVFVSHSSGRAIMGLTDAIVRELGAEVRVIPLLTGSLAPRGQPGDSYIGYMEYNTSQIVTGLLSEQIESEATHE